MGAKREYIVSERRRDDEGDFDEEYSTSDILQIVREKGTIGTGGVAKVVGCHRNTARARLKDLAEEGAVEKVQLGDEENSAFVWRAIE